MATKHEYYITGDDNKRAISDEDWGAQSFTPASSHTITSVKLKLARWSTPGEVTVSIKATDANGQPTSDDLCSGTTNGNALPDQTTGDWTEITLGNGTPLSADTKYAIVMKSVAAEVWWRHDSAGTYADGWQMGSENLGVDWTDFSDCDFMFEDWGVASPTETLRPNAAGDECSISSYVGCSACPNHYTCVDEEVSDGETTQVKNSVASYQRDLYNLPASSGSGTINSIKIYIVCCRGITGASGYAKPSLKSDGVVTDGTEIALTEFPDWILYSQQWNTNPADSEAWEWADIDALQIGVSLKGDGTYSAACTQVYIVVDYTTSPTVTTQVVKNIMGATATGQGNVTVLGGLPVTQHGHCWNTSTNPTTSHSLTENGAAADTGAFESSLTELTPNTGYYVRAYATNSAGTSYGDNVYFVATLAGAGYIWMEGSNLHGFDANAIERIYVYDAEALMFALCA